MFMSLKRKKSLEDPTEDNIKEASINSNFPSLDCISAYLNPPQIIKRIIHKPILGYWYPHVDVQVNGRDPQLSLLQGNMSIRLSKNVYCPICSQKLQKETRDFEFDLDFFPLASCSDCRARILHGYLECLDRIIRKGINAITFSNEKDTPNAMVQSGPSSSSMKEFKSNSSLAARVCCEDFFNSRCGIKTKLDETAPCYLNHSIGLILEDYETIKVIIGTIHKLKYMMMRNGGLMGVILGKTSQILNLDLFERRVPVYLQKLKDSVDLYGTLKMDEKINDLQIWFQTKHGLPGNPKKVNFWLLVNFLSYYKDSDFTWLYFKLFDKPLKAFRFIINYVVEHTDLELIDSIQIHKSLVPIKREIREACKMHFIKILDLDDLSDFSKDKLDDPEFNALLNNFEPFIQLSKSDFKEGVEIRTISGAMATYLIGITNKGVNPVIINSNHLLGRQIKHC